jgi:hypothetical protein
MCAIFRAMDPTIPESIPESIRAGAQSWTLEAGVVTGIAADPLSLVAHGAAMFADAPIRALELEDPEGEWQPDAVIPHLAASPWFSRVQSLTAGLYRDVAEGDILAVLVSAMPNLVTLRVPHPATILVCAQLPLTALAGVYIYCEGSDEGDAAIAALAKRPRSLRELQIVGCAVTDEAARTIALARWPLTRLAFGGTHYAADRLGARGAMALANNSSLSGLTTLDLVATGSDDDAVRVLAASPHLGALTELGLAENSGITDAGLAALAESPIAATLRRLAVHETEVTADGIAAFRARHPHVDVANHNFTTWGG